MSTEYFESLPDELKEASFFKPGDDGPKSLEQLVSDLNSAAQWQGNSIRIPGKDASDEDVAAFRQRATEKIPGLMVIPSMDDEEAMDSVFRSMGKPEKPEDYRLPEIEGIDWKDKDMSAAMAQSHALGLTQRQFEAMIKTQHEEQTTASERQQHELTEALDALKAEWGSAFDSRVNKVREALDQIEAPDYVKEMLNSGTLPAGDLRMFYNMADALGSEGTEITKQDNQQHVLTPDQAAAELSEINSRIVGPNADVKPDHPDYARLSKRRVELMKLKYPDSSTEDLRQYG